MSSKIVHVSDEMFEDEVLKSELPVLVDFWAEWCGPCRMVAPILDQLAEEYESQIKIAKVNVDENPTISAKFGIRNIPTLLIFKQGNVEASKFSSASKSQLAAFIEDNIDS